MDESAMNNDLPYPIWQGCYRDALVELDHEKLVERVREAELAIVYRLETLRSSRESLVELQAIEDALANLRCLKRETETTSEHSKFEIYRPSLSEIGPEVGNKSQGE